VPLLDLIDSPANPAPEGGVVARVRAADGLPIRVARWHPEGRARGTIVVVQGRAEYIEKYFETIGELLQRGFCVVSFDWRGQGLSGREIAIPARAISTIFLSMSAISRPSSIRL